MNKEVPRKGLNDMLNELSGNTRSKVTIEELHDVLGELIRQGHGDKEFQLLYDGEMVYTTIKKDSPVRIDHDSVMFTDD